MQNAFGRNEPAVLVYVGGKEGARHKVGQSCLLWWVERGALEEGFGGLGGGRARRRSTCTKEDLRCRPQAVPTDFVTGKLKFAGGACFRFQGRVIAAV